MTGETAPQVMLNTWNFRGVLPQAVVYQNALAPALFKKFQTWALAVHPTPQDRTVWYPLNRPPKYLPEQVIQALYPCVRPLSPDIRGAEWWMGYRRSEESLHYHVDRDESLFKEKKIYVTPLVSTVFYLTRAGGATFIPNDFIKRDTGKVSRAPVTSSLKIYPRPNKFLAFSGNLFHSVLPSEKPARKGGLRVTFIVNFWAKRPHKPVCVDPDPSYILRSLELDLSRERYS